MGIYKSFNESIGKWVWKGFRLYRTYDTEAECDADRENVWTEHMNNLEAWNFACRLLASYR